MKKYIKVSLALQLLFCAALAYGQSIEPPDSIQFERKKNFEIYIGAGYQNNQFVETSASFAGIYLGVLIKERLDLNFSYAVILDNFKQQLIFPSTHRYDQRNYRIGVQYSFLKTKVRPHIGTGYNYNRAFWNPLEDSDDTFNNNFDVVEFYIGANWILNQVLTLEGSVGYNKASGGEMIGLSEDDYDGMLIKVALRCTLFKL